jgi:hypothetical protein
MAAFCVMVKGPCRGKMCDFWARVRLRKLDIGELVQEIRNSISICEENLGSTLDDAFSQYWTDFGIKDLKRFCEEAPDLCSKLKHAEEQIRKMIL